MLRRYRVWFQYTATDHVDVEIDDSEFVPEYREAMTESHWRDQATKQAQRADKRVDYVCSHERLP